MSSEFGDRKVARVVAGAPPEPENVPCPRCESTNTKFCYYNNYNLSQPRYFCKGCRRYWTRGGTLRNIPVGGGTRRNTKRSRPAGYSAAAAPDTQHVPPLTNGQHVPPGSATNYTASLRSPVIESSASSAPPGSYEPISLLGSQHGGAFLGLGGYGLGSGLEGLAFGPVGEGGGGESAPMCDTWQSGMADGGDCYGWPDLAMSMPGTAGLE